MGMAWKALEQVKTSSTVARRIHTPVIHTAGKIPQKTFTQEKAGKVKEAKNRKAETGQE